jgi:hypothetical protein
MPDEAIGKPLPQMLAGIVVGIEGKCAFEGEGTQVIDTAYMVVVLVSDEDSIQRIPHLNTQHLFAEVRSAIQ